MTISKDKKRLMLSRLLDCRVENYGYDPKDFSRIAGQRKRARLAVKRLDQEKLKWEAAPLASRIDWEDVSYVTGQSQNEEITNLLRQLLNPNARWVS